MSDWPRNPTDPRPPWARLFEGLAALLALLGGAVLSALAGMSVASIAMRAAGFEPIAGDYELVQNGLAVSIALVLPWCQLKGANVTVDFFTTWVPARPRRRLDAAGAFLVAAVMALVAWRVAAGAIDLKASGETTMLVELPLWITYSVMLPGFALASGMGLYTAWKAWMEAGGE